MVNPKDLYDRLVETAQAGKTLTYSEVARLLSLDASDPYEKMILSRVLDEISCNENAQGRPLLSAVVVMAEIGYPAKGFFLLARELGLNTYCDDRSFFSHELKRVHDYWRERRVERQAAIYIQHRRTNRVPMPVH
ncbi:MAG TPA: hypothetical protein VF813_02340 [Anaerolineaceae bacterium]